MEDLDPQEVVEIGKDKAINKRLEDLRSKATPLEAGVTPVPTQAVIIPGEQTKLNNATIVGPDGEPGPSGVTGYMQPIALVVLDQGGNIMKAPNDMFVVENAQPVNDDAKQIVASGGQITSNGQEKGKQAMAHFMTFNCGCQDHRPKMRSRHKTSPSDSTLAQRQRITRKYSRSREIRYDLMIVKD